jgi:hypothetical protein
MLKTASGRGYRLLGAWTPHQGCTSSVNSLDLEPMRSPAEPLQTNLPAATSELVGANAAQHLRGLLSAYRVVTLTGLGGIGKTRLTLEVARGVFPSFEGDVQLVELVSLSDPGLVNQHRPIAGKVALISRRAKWSHRLTAASWRDLKPPMYSSWMSRSAPEFLAAAGGRTLPAR